MWPAQPWERPWRRDVDANLWVDKTLWQLEPERVRKLSIRNTATNGKQFVFERGANRASFEAVEGAEDLGAEARRARDLSLRKRRPVIPKPSRYEAKPRADRTDAEAESRLRTLMAEVDTNLYQLTLPEQVRDAEGWFLKKRSNARQLRSKSIANPLVASQRWLNGPRIAEHKAA